MNFLRLFRRRPRPMPDTELAAWERALDERLARRAVAAGIRFQNGR